MLTPSDSECLAWLDRQPPESVLFISLGRGGNLMSEQLTELDRGLELSQQWFFWVARALKDVSGQAIISMQIVPREAPRNSSRKVVLARILKPNRSMLGLRHGFVQPTFKVKSKFYCTEFHYSLLCLV